MTNCDCWGYYIYVILQELWSMIPVNSYTFLNSPTISDFGRQIIKVLSINGSLACSLIKFFMRYTYLMDGWMT